LIKRGREDIKIIDQRVADNVVQYNKIKDSPIFDAHLVWDHSGIKSSKIELLNTINKL